MSALPNRRVWTSACSAGPRFDAAECKARCDSKYSKRWDITNLFVMKEVQHVHLQRGPLRGQLVSARLILL